MFQLNKCISCLPASRKSTEHLEMAAGFRVLAHLFSSFSCLLISLPIDASDFIQSFETESGPKTMSFENF